MNVAGIVAEYNPFHNGHLYHMESARKITNCEAVVVVMSGSFCQRGEPAIIDKFSRAEAALQCGADLVLELPFCFAVQDAGGFAKGAVSLLSRTGVVTDIVFGSESGNLEALSKMAHVLVKQPPPFPELIHKELKKGLSFPNARKKALLAFFQATSELNPQDVLSIEKSNDILGLEYVKALIELSLSMKPHVVKRVGANYLSSKFSGTFSSATAIRESILCGRWDNVSQSVPEKSLNIILRELNEGRGPVALRNMESLILSSLRLKSRRELENIYGFSEGLEKRFIKCAAKAGTLEEFFKCVNSKRFTLSKIKRLSLFSFFNLDREFMEKSNKEGPQYLRVLGFNTKGQNLLS
ncbi:MAG: nucleotidyltransferase, partial [Thermotogae bacterium]